MRQQLKLYLLMLGFGLALSPTAAAGEDPTFTTIDFLGASFTSAVGINPQGDIVGAYASAGVLNGYLLSGDSFTTIDFPGASGTAPRGINPRGDIVGIYVSADKMEHGYLLSGGQYSTIDFPGATLTHALNINPEGDIVGRYVSAVVSHDFLLSRGQFTTFDLPGASLDFWDQPSRRHLGNLLECRCDPSLSAERWQFRYS
jgi:hypothetical protein